MKRARIAVTRAAFASVLAGMLAFGVLGAPGAGADLQSFTTSANGFALRVTVDLSGLPAAVKSQVDTAYAAARNALPAEAQAKVPTTFPYVLDQYFVKTTADASSSATRALSVLGEGFQNLNSKSATTVGESQTSNEASVMIPQDATLQVLEATGGVLKSSVGAGPKVDGSATLASVSATLQNVNGLLPAQLQQAFADLVTQVNGIVATATTQVQSTVNTVETTLIGALPQAVKDALPAPVVSDLSAAIQVPQIPNPLNVNLATISAIANTTTSQKTAAGVASADASSTMASVSVLNGFITAGAVNLASHSQASGTPGSATNSSDCRLADVRLGGTSGVGADGKNLYVNVNGQAVAVPVVGDTVNAVKAQVDQVLGAAGIGIKLCDTAQAQKADDGKSASQSVSAFVITFAPKAPAAIPALGINQGDTLVKIVIDPTVQTSVSAAPVVTAAQELPNTGANAAGTVVVGLVITGGALYLRRRALGA